MSNINDIYEELKKGMDNYNSDFERAIKRSEEIDTEERTSNNNLYVLESFGPI